MKYLICILLIVYSILLGQYPYGIGDQITEADQNETHDICYPKPGAFQISDYSKKVIWIEFSASW